MSKEDNRMSRKVYVSARKEYVSIGWLEKLEGEGIEPQSGSMIPTRKEVKEKKKKKEKYEVNKEKKCP